MQALAAVTKMQLPDARRATHITNESSHVGGHGPRCRAHELLKVMLHSHKLFVHRAADRKLAVAMIFEKVSQLFQGHSFGLWPKQALQGL